MDKALSDRKVKSVVICGHSGKFCGGVYLYLNSGDTTEMIQAFKILKRLMIKPLCPFYFIILLMLFFFRTVLMLETQWIKKNISVIGLNWNWNKRKTYKNYVLKMKHILNE